MKSYALDVYVKTRAKASLLRGEYNLNLPNNSARFVAENEESIVGNIRRFRSEKDRLELLLDDLDTDDVFFDIGANTGLYSSFAASKASKVVAFEPYPQNLVELEKNLKLNGGNTDICAKALSNKNGEVGFEAKERVDSKYPGVDSPGFGRGTITETGGKIQVETIRGDTLVENGGYRQPNVVKIDVEGSEPLVIDGLTNTLTKSACRIVYCEVHRESKHRKSIDEHGYNEDDLIDTFNELGFTRIETYDNNGTEFLIVAKKPQ